MTDMDLQKDCPKSGLIVTVLNDGVGADILGSISSVPGVWEDQTMLERLEDLQAFELAENAKVRFARFNIPYGRSAEFARTIRDTFAGKSWAQDALLAVEPDHPVTLDAGIGQGFQPGGQHNDYKTGMGVPDAHAAGWKGQGVKIAVIDTGYAGPSPSVFGWDVVGPRAVPAAPVDVDGHGTAMIELARDVAPDAELHFIRACERSGPDMTIWGLMTALLVASRDADADIISMSLGFSDMDQPCPFCGGSAEMRSFALECVIATVADAMNQRQRRPILVAASGNGGSDTLIKAPAVYGDVVTIGSVARSGALSRFSNFDKSLRKRHHFMAFGGQTDAGGQIVEHTGAGTTGTCYGTSAATAYAAGMMAVFWQQHGPLDRDSLLSRVRQRHSLACGPAVSHGAGLLCFDPARTGATGRGVFQIGRTKVPLP